jgi:hypothetical protein
MAKELGTEQKIDEVRERFLYRFADIFGYRDVREGLNDGLCLAASAEGPTAATIGTF